MDQPSWTLSVPLSVPLSTRAKFHLNLNQYRNAHYRTLTLAKNVFTEMVRKDLEALPVMGVIQLDYRLYPSGTRQMDISNICSIIDKFFCDALVETGRIPDDQHQIVTGIRFSAGPPDKADPRVDITIQQLGEIPEHLWIQNKKRKKTRAHHVGSE